MLKTIIRKQIPISYRLTFFHALRYFSILQFNVKPTKKIILYGSGRSGSTLLTSLFNSHKDIYFEGELLARKTAPNVWFPKLYMKALEKRVKKSNASIYGLGLMSTQLEGQKHLTQEEFLKYLHQRGWLFVHIRRTNILKIVLSLLRAKKDQEWVSKTANNQKMTFPILEVIELIKHLEHLYFIEDRIMEQIPHHKVIYEKDLENGNFQNLMDHLFNHLEMETCQVETSLIKKTSGTLEDIVENYVELKTELVNRGYEKFLF